MTIRSLSALAAGLFAATVFADDRPAGRLPVSGFRIFTVSAALGPLAAAPDEKSIIAGVEGAAEAVVVSLETGAITARIALPEPAAELHVCAGRIAAVGRRTVTRIDPATGKVLGTLEPPLAEIAASCASADETKPTLYLIGRKRDATAVFRAVAVDVTTGKVVGEPIDLPGADSEPLRCSVSGDGGLLYVCRPGTAIVYDLTRGGAVVHTTPDDPGRIRGDRTGRFAFASDGRVFTADLRFTVGRLAGGTTLLHPTLPLVVNVAAGMPRPNLDDTGAMSTVRVYAMPALDRPVEWTAPATIIGRPPVILPKTGRIAIAARSVQLTGDAAALLASGAAAKPVGAALETVGKTLLGAVPFLGGPKPGSLRLRDITDELGKPSEPAPAAPAAGGRETYLAVVGVALDRIALPPAVMFTLRPDPHARPGQDWTFAPTTRRVGSPEGDVIFAKAAGPAGLTVEAATGRCRFRPTFADLGDHRVELIATAGGTVDRLTFELSVQLAETPIRMPATNRGTIPITLPTVSADGRTLVCTDLARRTLFAFPLDGPDGRPADALVTRALPAAVSAMTAHGALVACISEQGSEVVLLNPRTLAVERTLPLPGLQPRRLLSFEPRPHAAIRERLLLVSGIEEAGRQPRTLVFDTDTARTVGDPIPLGGRLAAAPDGRSIYIGDPGSVEVVLYDLAARRVTDTRIGGRGGAFVPAGWATDPAGLRGGFALHPEWPIGVVWGDTSTEPAAVPVRRSGSVRLSGRTVEERSAERRRPVTVSIVSADSGRVIKRLELPAPGGITDAAFVRSAEGWTLILVSPDRLQQPAFDPAALMGEGPIFVGDPNPAVTAGGAWEYRPTLLPPNTKARIEAVSGPIAADADTGIFRFRPALKDVGEHTARLRAVLPDGRSTEQAFTITVRPAGFPVTGMDGRWFADDTGARLIRVIDRKIEIHPISGGPMQTVTLADRIGSAALRGRTLVCAVPNIQQVVFVDLGQAKVSAETVLIDDARPARVALFGDDGDILVSDDRRHIHRIDPKTHADAGVVAHGAVFAADALGRKLYSAVPADALPRELQDELLRIFWNRRDDSVTAVNSARGVAPVKKSIPKPGETGPTGKYLLTYVRTDTAYVLADAVPIGSMPAAMAVIDGGATLACLTDAGVQLRPVGDFSRPAKTLAPPDDVLSELIPTGPFGPVLCGTRGGRLFRIEGGELKPDASVPAELAVGRAGRTPIRAVAPESGKWLAAICAGRVHLLPAPVAAHLASSPRIEGLPNLAYRPGATWGWRPELADGADAVWRLVSGPPKSVVDPDTGEVHWTPVRSEAEMHRLVIEARHPDGRTVLRGLLLRRERE